MVDHKISPLKPEELQVLRAQYEKEGEYVGVQTKFNYAWVPLCGSMSKRKGYSLTVMKGSDKIFRAQRAARGRASPFGYIP